MEKCLKGPNFNNRCIVGDVVHGYICKNVQYLLVAGSDSTLEFDQRTVRGSGDHVQIHFLCPIDGPKVEGLSVCININQTDKSIPGGWNETCSTTQTKLSGKRALEWM